MTEKQPHCMAPFVQLTLRHDGYITPCCYLYSHFLGKAEANQSVVAENWNSEAMQAFREAHLKGTPPPCATYSRTLRCEQDFEKWRTKVIPSVVMKEGPRRLDIRMSGECNLHCIMCDVWKNKGSPYTEENFWQRAPEEIFPYIEEIDLVGGEPFVQSYTFRLLEEAFAINPKIRFGFITNAQWEWTSQISALLEKIHIAFIQVSLDSLQEENYAQIRRDGSLKKSLHALEQLLVLRTKKDFPLAISQLLSVLNWEELEHFAAFAKEKVISPRWQLLYAPDTLSLFQAPEKIRKAALKHWEAAAAQHSYPQIAELVKELRN